MKRIHVAALFPLLLLAVLLSACSAPAAESAPPSQSTAAATDEAAPESDGMTQMLMMMTTVAIAQGAPMLGIQGLEADLETGDITLTPPEKTVTTQLGNVTVVITPTLTVNLIQRSGGGTSDMLFIIPDVGTYHQISHFVFTPATGFSGGQTQIIRFNVMGVTLNADLVGEDEAMDGTGQLVFQPLGTIALEKWAVRNDPETGEPVSEMVIVGEFNLPDLHVGSVIALEDVNGGLRVSLLTGRAPDYQVALGGKLSVSNLPGDLELAANTFRLSVRNGKTAVDVRDVALMMAGQPLFEFAQSPN